MGIDDPDAPRSTFVHWVFYGLSPDKRRLPEGVPVDERPAAGGVNGKNSAGGSGYTSPCPPSGSHRYFFKLYALDSDLGAAPGLSKEQLLQAMDGHILAQGELMGIYARRS